MIRIGLPQPTLLRLRLRAQITANQVARQAETFRQGVLTTLHRDMTALRRLPRAFAPRSAAGPRAIEDSRALLAEFETHYQGLVDLLCWSAKDGIHDGRDERYNELRDWFLTHYGAIRPALRGYLEVEAEDLAAPQGGMPGPRDTFESLFLPENVEAIIHSETVISRIMRTRSALDAYREKMDSAR